MKHSIKLNGSTIPVELFVTVFDKQTGDILDESFDNLRDAYYFFPRNLYRFAWSAARIIDEFGNLDFPVYASSKFRALSDLKKSLY